MVSSTHKFKVGQRVELIPSVSRLAANGHYQVISVRPSEGEIPHYRIKSIRELHERVVAEDELTLLDKSDTV
jgi:hypothetical protein